jgi:succinate dehydrogenase / fumarate reductase cytochrome b subunit
MGLALPHGRMSMEYNAGLERWMKVLQAFSTSVGSKILIALTGLALVGFLVFHLAGNLLVFLGPASYNEHAHALISNPLVIPAEIGLAAIFLLHMVKTLFNFGKNRAARPEPYARRRVWAGGASRKSVGSTTMIVSGLVTFAFVVLHLATFKYGPYYASPLPGERDLYRLLIEVFHEPVHVVVYVVCMAVIGLHLRHGISSAFQSLGLMPESWVGRLLRAGMALAVLIGGGFLLIPVWVYFFL